MPHDRVHRVITNDYAFRVIVADLSETARGVVNAQKLTGAAAERLAELVIGTVLVRETMAPNLRVQGIIKGAGGTGTLVGDSHPSGDVRGLAQLGGSHQDFKLGPGARMQVMRSLPNGSLQQGIVEASAGGISDALMTYLQESEQVASVVGLGVLRDGDRIARAGGYIVQLLPEVERAAGMVMAQRLEDFPPVEKFLHDESFSTQMLLDELLYQMPYSQLEASEVRSGCWCSEAALFGALATLDRKEVEDMVEAQEALEITCDYCGKDYSLAPERLRGLIQKA